MRNCKSGWQFKLLFSVALTACAADPPTVITNPSREILLWQQSTLFTEVAPRVDQNNVYLYDAANVLHAVAKTNGVERWNKKVMQPLATSELHVGTGVVLLASDDLVALDNTTGNERWRQAKPAGQVVAMRDNVLAVTTGDLDGAVRFLEPATGQQRFRTSVLPIDTTSALTNGLTFVHTVVTSNSVVSSFEFGPAIPFAGGIAVFDAATGARRWSRRIVRAGQGAERPRYIAVANGVVVVAGRGGGLFAYDEFTGNALWTANTLIPAEPSAPGYTGTVAIIGNYVTVVTLALTVDVFDLQTGNAVGALSGPLDQIRDLQALRGSQAFTQSSIRLAIIDVATGIRRWEVLAPRFSYQRAFVVLAGDTLFDATSAFGLRSFKLPP